MSRHTNADVLQAISESRKESRADNNRLSDKIDLIVTKVNTLEVAQASLKTHQKVIWSVMTAVGTGLIAMVIKVLF